MPTTRLDTGSAGKFPVPVRKDPRLRLCCSTVVGSADGRYRPFWAGVLAPSLFGSSRCAVVRFGFLSGVLAQLGLERLGALRGASQAFCAADCCFAGLLDQVVRALAVVGGYSVFDEGPSFAGLADLVGVRSVAAAAADVDAGVVQSEVGQSVPAPESFVCSGIGSGPESRAELRCLLRGDADIVDPLAVPAGDLLRVGVPATVIPRVSCRVARGG